MDNQIILEFNEEIKSFHYNHIIEGKPQSTPDTHGYKKLLVCRNCEEADMFADFLSVQFILCGKDLNHDLASSTIVNLIDFITAYHKLIYT